MDSGRSLTSQSLQNVAVCKARGFYVKSGAKRLPMSPFAAEHTQAGLAFEKEIETDPELLLRLLRAQRPGLLPKMAIPVVQADRDAGGASVEGGAAATRGREILRSAKIDLPMLVYQLVLEAAGGLAGRPDWCLWTGKYWVLIEMKRSEMPLAIHGVQLSFYREMLRLELGVDAPIFPEAFILHCEPGYLYVSRDSQLKKEALDHLALAVFPLDLLEAEKDRLKAEVAALEKAPEPEERQFTGACIECSFKPHCYPSFFDKSNGTSLSLVPLPISDREVIESLGFESLEQVAGAEGEKKLRDFRNGRSEQIRGLRHRAAVACSLHGFSDWRSHRGWKQHWMTYAYQPLRDDRPESEAWGTESDHFVETPSTLKDCAEVIICYTEREVRRAKYRLHQNGLMPSEINQLTFVCLVDEIRESVHLPLVSYTLPEVAEVMQAVEAGGSVDRVVLDQLARLAAATAWPVPKEQVHRLLMVEQVWRGLLYLEEVCWGRRVLL
jgi:hypothetical protein